LISRRYNIKRCYDLAATAKAREEEKAAQQQANA
jgi:hypothetical protein